MIPTRRMSHLDAALFALETPTNHMNLGLLAEFGEAVEDPTEVLRSRLSERSRYYDLRLIVQPSKIGYTAPKLVDGGPIDLDYHVQEVTLGGSGTDADLDEWLGRELSYPLDRHKPLWQMHVIKGLSSGGFALFLKGHHGIMDGPAALNTALQIMDGVRSESSTHATRGFLRGNLGRFSSVWGGIQDYFGWPARLIKIALDPSRSAVRNQRMKRARAFNAPRTSLNRSISGDRTVVRNSVNLEDVIDARREAGCTGTDVILSMVSTSIRKALETRKELPLRSLVALVPVAQSGDLWRKRSGNRISFEFISLATNVANPRDRLDEIAESSKQARKASRLRGGDLWERYAGLVLPGPFHQIALLAERIKLSNRIRPMSSLIVSNLTGPRTNLSLGGAEMKGLWPFGPPKDGSAINVTAVSYLDRLYFGIAGDKNLQRDLSVMNQTLPTSLTDLVELQQASL